MLAKGELESAVPLAAQIQDEVMSGEAEAAKQTFKQFDAHVSTAAALTSDPIWRAFEVLPLAGPNLTAVRELATVVNDISSDAIGPLTKVVGAIELSDFKPVGGAIALQPLVDARPQISAANAALIEAEQRVQRIDASQTLAPVRVAAEELKTKVAKAAESLNAVDSAVQLLPSMLGASEPRNYLLLFQNPAELRATGGNPGAIALVHAEDGRISLAAQASSGDFPFYETPVLELPAETRSLYGDITGQYIQDVNLTPSFPLSAQLAREMWKREQGAEVDGVLSIDPVALSYLLTATGPITLPTGDVLNAENAVQLLLRDAYARYENPADQDAFFAAAAASVFTAVSSGDVDPVALTEALAKAGEERRVLVWNARDEEQAILADTTLSGSPPTSDDETTTFGVYLNDATGSKMGLYLEAQVATGQVTCRDDARPNYGVTVTLTNTAPLDAATALPTYVTGGGDYGVTAGNVKAIVTVYGAPGMQNLGMARDGASTPYYPTTDATYPVSQASIELAPGESTTLQFGWLGEGPFDGEVTAQSTPRIQPSVQQTAHLTCQSPPWGPNP